MKIANIFVQKVGTPLYSLCDVQVCFVNGLSSLCVLVTEGTLLYKPVLLSSIVLHMDCSLFKT